MIIIDSRIRQLLIDDALNTFPDECCGFLFGREETDGTRLVLDILVVDNSKEGDKTRRFVISPLDYMTAEQHALDHDWTLLGIYHSHPKHPAIPSEHDRIAAQPYFSYVIISVLDRETINLRSWLLNEDAQFEEEPITDDQLTEKHK
ncbi:MAG: M67 family metallopeptidase [Bacteroidetes bacterium]|nr:M67 family metallopeptidase [Bacteroidota bacterium]